MEKRTFLAIFLSFMVLVLYQVLFAPQPDVQKIQSKLSQTIESEEVISSEDTLPTMEVASVVTPIQESFEEREYVLENDELSLVLSNKGGDITDAYLKQYEYDIPIGHLLNIVGYEDREFILVSQTSDQIKLSSSQDGIDIEKTATLNGQYMSNLKVKVGNSSSSPKEVAIIFNAIHLNLNKIGDLESQAHEATLYEYSIAKEGKIKRKGNANKFSEKHKKDENIPVNWIGFRDRYFATIVHPEFSNQGYAINPIGEKDLDINIKAGSVQIAPGAALVYDFSVYTGPQELNILKGHDKEFEDILSFNGFGLIDFIAKTIHSLLRVIHKVIPNWGLCIILVSLLIYGISYPLTFKSMKSMKKMQAVQPKMMALKEKFKNDPQKMNQEVMKLYQTEGVNPIGGCLPMLLQMPIFIGLYQVLWRSIYFRGADFLWISDLSKPDQLFKLPFSIPFLGEYFNLLPVLMVGIMALQQKINAQSMVASTPEQQAQQKMMQTIFPIVLGVIFYNFASGLSLYFTVFYLLSTFTQWQISKMKVS